VKHKKRFQSYYLFGENEGQVEDARKVCDKWIRIRRIKIRRVQGIWCKEFQPGRTNV
jgi:2-keto-4-pentenoate hydratase